MSLIAKYQKQIRELEGKIKELQENCSHPPIAVMKKYSGNHGNYDPSSDCDSVTFCCLLCSKRWFDIKHTGEGWDEANKLWLRSPDVLKWDDALLDG